MSVDLSSAGGALLPVAEPAAVRRAVRALVVGNRRALAGTLVLNCLAAAAGLVPPWLLGTIVNDIVRGGTAARADLLAGGILVAALLQLVLTRYAQVSSYRFAENVVNQLRVRYLARVLALPTSTVERISIGDLLSRSTSDLATISRTARTAAPQILLAALQVLFIVVAALLIDPLLGACAALGVPVMYVACRWYLRRARAAYLAVGEANSALAETFAAAVDGARTAEVFGLQDERIRGGMARLRAVQATRMRTLALRSVLFPAVDIAHMLPVVAVVIGGTLLYRDGLVSLGACIAVSLYLWRMAEPLDTILAWLEELQSSGASFARVEGVPEHERAGSTGGRAPSDNHVVVSGVSFAYDDRGADVLRDLDLVVPKGVRLAIVGPTGAGKSTLGRLLMGVELPTAGSVTIGGVPVDTLDEDLRRGTVMLVNQEHHVFLCSLRENLAIASPTSSDRELLVALATVDADWVADLPDGLDTELGGGGVRLDAAQAQQVALARVLLADPGVVVLDEATALLSPSVARHAERAMDRALAQRTVVAIAHRLHTARDADLIAVLDEGRLAELGSHEELLAAGKTYAALWRTWQNAAAAGRQPE